MTLIVVAFPFPYPSYKKLYKSFLRMVFKHCVAFFRSVKINLAVYENELRICCAFRTTKGTKVKVWLELMTPFFVLVLVLICELKP